MSIVSLDVKAYILPCRWKGEDFQEIRRFTIAKNDAKDFKKLFAKLCEVFPSIEKDKISLHWKDNDGDLIHFTTNIELADAIRNATDGVFKLYVQEMPLFKDSNELHFGVVCSNCKKNVEGSRFKCLACHDYDLCHICELTGSHLEHTMIKIPTPSTPWLAQIMQYSYTYGPMSPMSPILLKCHTEDGGTRTSQPLGMDEQFSPVDRPSFASSIGQPHSRNEWSLFNDIPTSSRSDIAQAGAIERPQYSKEMQSRQNREDGLNPIDIIHKSPYRESIFNYSESPPEKTSGDWTLLDSSPKSKDIKTKTTRNSSSGINSSITKTKSGSIKVAEASSESEVSSVKTSEVTSTSFEHSEREQCGTIKSSHAIVADSTADESDNTTKEDQAMTDSVTKGTDAEAVATTTSSEDTGSVNNTDMVSSTTEDSKQEEAVKEEPNAPKPIVDNNLYYPKIRRYAEALDNLMSMGFTNEGGWLTILVEEKRGDIIRVLDFIENNIQKCRENENSKSRN